MSCALIERVVMVARLVMAYWQVLICLNSACRRLRSLSKVIGVASVCSVAAAYSEQQPRENVQYDGGSHGKRVWGRLKDKAMSLKSKDVEADLPMDKLACHRVVSNAKSQAVVLVACGSFNPPTLAHLRVLELVRQEFFRQGIDVLGAYLSPVNDEYNKTALLPSEHRVSMCEHAAEGSGKSFTYIHT